MTPWRIVWRKECTDAVRDRRSLLTALVFGPVLGPVVALGVLSGTLSEQKRQWEAPLAVPVVGGEQAPNFVRYLEAHHLDVRLHPRNAPPPNEALYLDIDADFGPALQDGRPATVHLHVDGANRAAHTQAARVRQVVQRYSQSIALLRLQARGLDPLIAHALRVEEHDHSTAQGRSALLLGMLPYLLILAVFIGGMYVAIDATAGERERKSLEPLLLNPVPRGSIMFGKLAATASFSVLSLVATLFVLAVALPLMPWETSSVEPKLLPQTALAMFFVLLPLVALAAATETVMAAMARSVREAQTYISLFLILPMIPSFTLMIGTVDRSLGLMSVPFVGHHLLLLDLLQGEKLKLVDVAASAGCAAGLALCITYVAKRIYDREGIVR